MGILIALIILLVLILILIGIIYYVYRRIKRKVEGYSNMFFGTTDLRKVAKELEVEEATTPKSVSSATSIYLPQIMKDFPEFHYDEMKTRAENVLTSYLRSIDGKSAKLLTEGTNELKDHLWMRIQMLDRQDVKECFRNIKVHRTEIQTYRKEKGRCSIVFQTAVEYIHFFEKDGKVVKGRNDLREQSKYNVEVVYIQDQDFVENYGEDGAGLNCPNCGAPLSSLGAKVCAYCDTPVIEFNIRTWGFSKVEEKA
ncbi:MAG: zinc ribbon domain-containing protein [Lachnospiraceae bacterium]|nr:zinc ribbon domain-containing protein [Lachnospiraceae bacterium]